MAQVPYSPDLQVTPSANPTPGLNVSVNPGAFGVGVGEGMQRAGQGIEQAANTASGIQLAQQERQNQIAVGAAYNEFQNHTLAVTAGSPDKPDDKGYYALQGQAALTAYPLAVDALEEGRKKIGTTLNDAQRIAFEEQSRRLQQYTLGGMRTHFIQQQNKWGETTWRAAEDTEARFVAANPTDPSVFVNGLERVTSAAVKRAADMGITPDTPDQFNNIVQGAHANLIVARLDGMMSADPVSGAATALNWFQNGVIPGTQQKVRELLPPHVQLQMEQHLGERGQIQAGQAAATALSSVSPGLPGPAGYGGATLHQTAFTPTAAAGGNTGPVAGAVLPQVEDAIQRAARKYPGYDPALARQTAMIESSGGRTSPNVMQFMPGTAKAMNVRDVNNLDDNVEGAARLQIQNRQALQNSLGRPPTKAEEYLAHQQGAAGAAVLIKNPGMPADEALTQAGVPIETAQRAITGNGGKLGMSAGAFINMWAQKFDGSTPAGAIDPTARAVVQREWNNFSVPGESPDNPGDVAAVNQRISDAYYRQTGGDPARFAVAYVSGLSNVADPGSPTPYKDDTVGANGQKTSAYVAQMRTLLDRSKADDYGAIMNNPNLTPRAKQAAFATLDQRYHNLAVAADVKTRAETSETRDVADGYMQQILSSPSATLPEDIAKDQRIHDMTTRHTLHTLALKRLGRSDESYSPKFLDALSRITDQSRPDRITDVGQLWSMVAPRTGPDGRPEPTLTIPDVKTLGEALVGMRKQGDAQAILHTLNGQLQFARDELVKSRETYPGSGKTVSDPEMEKLYYGSFLPKYFAQYSDHMQDPKNKPFDFLTKDKTLSVMDSVISRNERKQRQTLFNGGGGVTAPEDMTKPAPPPPAGADPAAWTTFISTPPSIVPEGATKPVQMSRGNWAASLQYLMEHPDTADIFDRNFGAHGFPAQRVLRDLPRKTGAAPAPTEGLARGPGLAE